MSIIFLFLIIPPILFLLIKYLGNKYGLMLPQNVQMWVLKIHGIFALLFIINFFLPANTYFRGYRSSSFIYLIMVLTGFVYVAFYKHNSKDRGVYAVYVFINLFLSVGAGFLIFEMIGNYKKQLVYNDKKYRVEFTNRGIMAPCGLPSLFIKNGIIEKSFNLGSGECLSSDQIDSVKVFEEKKNVIIVSIFHNADSSKEYPNPIVKKVTLE